MKKELLKKLKYNMPKEETGMPEMEMEMEGEEGPELEISMEEEEAGIKSPGLESFSIEELQAELERRKSSPEEEELPVEELV